MSNIDLNSPPPGHNYSVTVAKDEDTPTKWVRVIKDLLLFLSALTVVVILLYHATKGLQSPNPETQKWSMGFISATGGALIGYLVKK